MKCYIVTRSFFDESDWETTGFSYDNFPCGVYPTIEEATDYVRAEICKDKYDILNNQTFITDGEYVFSIYGMEDNEITDYMVIPVNETASTTNMTTREFIDKFTKEIPVTFEYAIKLFKWIQFLNGFNKGGDEMDI